MEKLTIVRRNLNLNFGIIEIIYFYSFKRNKKFTALKGNDLQYNYYLLIINGLKVVSK